MINKLTLKNFKRFHEAEIGLGNLTVLMGLNGAGKSSIIQSLLVARQSISGSDRPDNLKLSGSLCNLGYASDIFNHAAGDGDTLSIQIEGTTSFSLTCKYDTYSYNQLPLDVSGTPTASPIAQPGMFLYIPAERAGPRLSTPFSASDAEIGEMGSLAEGALAVLAHKRDETLNAGDPRLITGASTASIINQTKKYLDIISPNHSLDVSLDKGTDLVSARYTSTTSSNSLRPTNIGFGVSYVLPIIVSCLIAKKGSILIIENPEAHIHTIGQRAITDLLVNTAKAGVQIIIETHSREIYHHLRNRHSEHEDCTVTLHYFEATPPTHHALNPISAPLTDWPPSFFETMGTPTDLLRPLQ